MLATLYGTTNFAQVLSPVQMITLALVSIVFHLIFLLPRKIIQKIWRKGVFFRLLGGAINIVV